MIYAIGDIHGQAGMLDAALDLIAQDGGADAEVVFLGDFTDRGPDSRGVLDQLIAGMESGRNWRMILGNHDRMFLRFVTEGRQHDPGVVSGINWLNHRLGGTTTLASYGLVGTPAFADHRRGDEEILVHFETDDGNLSAEGVTEAAQKVVPQAHLEFLAQLPLWYATDELLFVHAGIRPGIPLGQQDPEDLIWIREGFLDDTTDHGRLIVHGHTALDTPAHFGNRVDLDGGAGYGRPLVPAVFEGRDCFLLTPGGRVPLAP